jgi:DNA-binding transcriptional MerR regulator
VLTTIDELAAANGVTTRVIRSFQTMGLLPHPELRGRTGLYGAEHQERLRCILRLQGLGFSLQSLSVLFDAAARGASLREVLGMDGTWESSASVAETDDAERYGFVELQRRSLDRRGVGSKPVVLSIVPTTVWEESRAS